MGTTTDTDLDLALIFALDTDEPKHCESLGHNAFSEGSHRGDDEVLWYARVTCGCFNDIFIRCQGWVDFLLGVRKLSKEMDMPGDYECLICGQEAITEVLERAN
jgi:hypothetical protein